MTISASPNYADQSKLRNTVAYATHAETGNPTHLVYPVSVHRNGDFYALYDFVEEGDSEYLRRLGLDQDGALYKVNNNLSNNVTGTTDQVDKITREYEDRSDFQEVIDAHDLSGAAGRTWYFDNFEIADMINYVATQNVMQNSDFGHKNMYWYRDSNDTLLWRSLVWDVDLSYGHKWVPSTNPSYFDGNLFSQEVPTAGFNQIYQNFMNGNLDARFQQMYRRRVRTLTEQLFGESGTPANQTWAYQEFQKWEDLTADEAAQDQSKWGLHPNFSLSPAQAVDQIQNSFIVNRRNRLLSFAGSQSSVQDVSIGTIEFAPSSGDEDQEYLALTNNNTSFAVDVSDWTLSGAIDHTLKPGTVIPAGETLYVLADVQGFQARTTGPRGGQQLFTQGNYAGRLSNGGGTLELRNAAGSVIDTESYTGVANNGDFNFDGAFDGLDFLTWQRGYGIASGAVGPDGDANVDGQVDQTDLGLWASNYGGQASTVAAVTGSLITGLADAGQSDAEDGSEELVAQFISLASWSTPQAEEPAVVSRSPAGVHDGAFASLGTARAASATISATTLSLAEGAAEEGAVDSDADTTENSASYEGLVDAVLEQGWG